MGNQETDMLILKLKQGHSAESGGPEMIDRRAAYSRHHLGEPYRSKNGEAQDAYARAHASAVLFLEKIRGRLEDADAPSEQTTWGHVANMTRLVDQLREIVEPS